MISGTYRPNNYDSATFLKTNSNILFFLTCLQTIPIYHNLSPQIYLSEDRNSLSLTLFTVDRKLPQTRFPRPYRTSTSARRRRRSAITEARRLNRSR